VRVHLGNFLYDSLSRVRPPPHSAPVPYTTLFRSIGNRAVRTGRVIPCTNGGGTRVEDGVARVSIEVDQGIERRVPGAVGPDVVEDAEEHTSELQSLAYLVCRLLLEKKNRG